MALPSPITNKGKGDSSQLLPSRHALNMLTKGDPVQRSLGQYGKKQPRVSFGSGAAQSAIDCELYQ